MGFYVVQHALQGPSGLPRDQSVNTFHFHKVTAGPPDFAALAVAVRNFYTTGSSSANTVEFYMNGFWLAAGHHIRVYDMTAPLHSPPIYTTLFASTSQTPPYTQPLPQEVALCLSYKTTQLPDPAGTDVPGSRPIERYRGRIYVGPLNIRSLVGVDQGSPEFNGPTLAANNSLVAGAQALYAGSFAAECQWSVYSKRNHVAGADPAMGTINEFETDDAWDTQRRRGTAATRRDKVLVGA